MLYFLFQIYLIILLYVCIANALRVVQIITFGTFGTLELWNQPAKHWFVHNNHGGACKIADCKTADGGVRS